MTKFIEKDYLVHYYKRSEGSRRITISQHAAGSCKEAMSLACATVNIRKKNIQGVELVHTEHTIDDETRNFILPSVTLKKELIYLN